MQLAQRIKSIRASLLRRYLSSINNDNTDATLGIVSVVDSVDRVRLLLVSLGLGCIFLLLLVLLAVSIPIKVGIGFYSFSLQVCRAPLPDFISPIGSKESKSVQSVLSIGANR